MKLLSANELKIIAIISMFIDHLGYFIFPDVIWLRLVGRLAYPIFAFFIAEGYIHTKNKKRYLIRILVPGIIYTLATFIFTHMLYGNILITFALSLFTMYVIEYAMKKSEEKNSVWLNMLKVGLVVLTIGMIFILCQIVDIDYGFVGIMAPVTCWIFGRKDEKYGLIAFGVSLILLSVISGGYQILCIVSLAPLSLYNEKVGKPSMKKFFYWFYPGHIILIQLISGIVNAVS